MVVVKKFLFDNDFEAPSVPEKPDSAPGEPPEEIEEPEEEAPPTFTQDDLDAMRAEGYEAGKKDALAETAEATQAHTLMAVKAVEDALAKLFAVQSEKNDAMSKDAMAAAIAITRKVFPDLNRRNALGEVEGMVKEVLGRVIEEPRLTLRVNAGLRGSFEERIGPLTQAAGYGGKVVFATDSDVALGDCKIEWGNGGAERNLSEILNEIDRIIERNLGAATSHAIKASPLPPAGEPSSGQEREREAPGAESVIEPEEADDPSGL